MAVQAQSPLLSAQELMENGWINHSFFDLQQQQQQQQIFTQQQQIQNHQHMYQNQNLLVSNFTNGLPSILFCQSISAQEEKQRQEMDQYVKLHNERLRSTLREQMKQQLGMALKTIESTTVPLLRQKDEEIAEATRRSIELEDLLKRLEMENQEWQRIAQDNEAMVVSLNNKLVLLLHDNNNNNNGYCAGCNDGGEAEDVESCCDVDEEKKTETNKETAMVCRGCKSGDSCVLFLPCRHICSCQACEAFLDSCPICNTAKRASIEVLL